MLIRTTAALALALASCTAASAAPIKTVGNWSVDFDEATACLKLENAARRVSLRGTLGFTSRDAAWKVVLPRDAARDRLSLANPGGTVLGYVSFRGEGDTLTAEVLHRAGANFFPGVLSYRAKATVRARSFACQTIPEAGERVLNFGDGAADTALNDSVFAPEEDLAVRFFSIGTSVASCGDGAYEVALAADVDDPALACMTVVADGAYYRSRWAPGYHPLDRRRCPKAPTGWMSWNTYFDKAGSAETLAEAKIAAKYLKPFGLDIFSIESWQDNSLWLPVSTFRSYCLKPYKPQFPEGMKWLADELRKMGFKPGIWMTLYGDGDQAFHDANRDLFLHDAKGRPIDCWAGKYMLDTTNPKALELMRRCAKTAREEWGYEFFKFDGMANTPRKFERPEIRACAQNPADAKWFENSVRTLREAIGDALFLGCMGDFTGTEAQFLDASRLGSDVVGCYRGVGESYHPLGNNSFAQRPVKWKNVLHQAECTFTQVFVNNIMFYTDPDTLLVGEALERHEAEVMATIVGLPGQLMFAGDKLGTLTYDRMKIIQQVLPVADVHPQNLYPFSASSMIPIWNLTVTRPFGMWHVVALFNFDDEPRTIEVPFASLGLDAAKAYDCYEFWRQEFVSDVAGSLAAELPMRSVKLFAIREAADHPQFVGDDRHVTQGAVEVENLAWDAAANTYRMDVKAVSTFPFVYAVRVPEGFRLVETKAEGGSAKTAASAGVARVTVSAKDSGTVRVALRFARVATKDAARQSD